MKIKLFEVFKKNTKKTELIGTLPMEISYFGGRRKNVRAAVYKEFNPKTGKIYRIYASSNGINLEINIDYFLVSGECIEK